MDRELTVCPKLMRLILRFLRNPTDAGWARVVAHRSPNKRGNRPARPRRRD